MNRLVVTLGALLLAAPVFSQVAHAENEAVVLSQVDITKFHLHETRADVSKILGAPAKVETSGDLESWQYQIGVEDHHDFSPVLVFRISTGELISVTYDFPAADPLDALFPASETRTYFYPDAKKYGVRMRRLTGGRLLLAMGSAESGAPIGQLLLIREAELPRFYSWISTQMGALK